MTRYPTEFRGCIWDDGWEYDAPCVIYYPWRLRRYDIGSNAERLESMVEDICYDIGGDRPHQDGGLDRTCKWRGWGHGFSRRRRATHVVFKVVWAPGPDGRMWAEVVSKTEHWGPPPTGNNENKKT